MKTISCSLPLLMAFALATAAGGAVLSDANTPAAIAPPGILFRSDQPNPARARWQAAPRAAHQTKWTRLERQTNALTGQVREIRHAYVELATGLNRRDATGRWQSANPAFTLTDRGAEATSAVHRVLLAPDINSAGAARIEKDGVTLQLHPLCLGYYDPTDGRSVALAELTHATGWLVASNVVVYSNCFDGLRASIRFRNSLAGLASDLVLHEQPLPPSAFGFSPQSRLELFTELIGDTPTPALARQVLRRETDPARRQQMVEPDFVDATLDFGALRMGAGRAFLAGTNALRRDGRTPVPVGKRFEVIGERRVLIEAVEWSRMRRLLTNLPSAASSGTITNAALPPASTGNPTRALARVLPAPRALRPATARIQTAAAGGAAEDWVADRAPAFVLDWEAQITKGDESATDFTFEEGVTYWITGTFILGGTTTFREGAILKFADWLSPSAVQINGPVLFQGSAYRPVILTGKDDDRFGVILPGSTGAPWNGRYGAPMLYFGADAPGADLAHFRLSFAHLGLWFDNGGQENLIRHAQIDRSWTPTYGGLLRVRNVLAHDVDQVFYGATAHAEHLTVHTAFWVADSTTLCLTNSLVVNTYDAPEWYVTDHTAWRTEQDAVFQTVGAGAHYLADPALRDAGTSAIDPTLATELRQTTTHPPTVLSEVITEDTTLGPTPIADVDEPDLGYHYPLVHFAAGTLHVQNATLTLGPGTALAGFGSGALWLDGGHLRSEGTWQSPNRIFPYAVVQEQPLPWGGAPNIMINTCTYGSTPPSIRLRRTLLERPRADSDHVYSSDVFAVSMIELVDCEVRGGRIYTDIWEPAACEWAMTNNLLFGVACQFSGGPGLAAFNNTFKACRWTLYKWGTPAWVFRDNLLDDCAIDQWEANVPPYDTVTHSHNGYVNMAGRLLPTPGPGDRVLAALPYAPGFFGHYYLPAVLDGSPNPLLNAGSRSAPEAGLFHYTTTGLGKEADTAVDFGTHYMMAGGSVLSDQDGDSIQDYLEDANGNGLLDGGETSSHEPL